jgi:hypothetical protein
MYRESLQKLCECRHNHATDAVHLQRLFRRTLTRITVFRSDELEQSSQSVVTATRAESKLCGR